MYFAVGVILVLLSGIFSAYGFDNIDFLRSIETDSIFLFVLLPFYLFKIHAELRIFNGPFVHRYVSRLRLFKHISRQITICSVKFVLIMFLSILFSSVIFYHNNHNGMIIEMIILMMKIFMFLNIVTYIYILLSVFFKKEALVATYVYLLIENYIFFVLIFDSKIPLMLTWYFYTKANSYLVVLMLTLFMMLIKSLSSTLFQRKDYI